jgi:hypothetical protein
LNTFDSVDAVFESDALDGDVDLISQNYWKRLKNLDLKEEKFRSDIRLMVFDTDNKLRLL